jgi:hypothetical protein
MEPEGSLPLSQQQRFIQFFTILLLLFLTAKHSPRTFVLKCPHLCSLKVTNPVSRNTKQRLIVTVLYTESVIFSQDNGRYKIHIV